MYQIQRERRKFFFRSLQILHGLAGTRHPQSRCGLRGPTFLDGGTPRKSRTDDDGGGRRTQQAQGTMTATATTAATARRRGVTATDEG